MSRERFALQDFHQLGRHDSGEDHEKRNDGDVEAAPEPLHPR